MECVFCRGQEIEYSVQRSRKRVKQLRGRIVQVTDSHVTVNLGSYRDTFLLRDVSPAIPRDGGITILSLKGDAGSMPKKIERPPTEELQRRFDLAGGKVLRAAGNADPVVSDVTMGRWLREVGIIGGEMAAKIEDQMDNGTENDAANQPAPVLSPESVISSPPAGESALDIELDQEGEPDIIYSPEEEFDSVARAQEYFLARAQVRVYKVINDPVSLALVKELISHGFI